MSIFDDILSAAPAEDQTVFNRYPQLRQSVEKMEADLGTVSQYAGKWVDWQKDNWDAEAGMTRAEKTLRDELTAAQAKLTAGVRSGADAGTVDALRKEFEAKAKEIEAKSLQAIEGMNLFYQATATRMLPHQQEFKENLDPKVLMKFMQDNHINDPDVAYDKMVAGKRQELSAQAAKDLETKHAADIAAAEQRGADKKAQELAMGPGGMLPTDNTGGIAGITARIDQPAKVSDEVKAKVADAKLGDGSLADLGYKMFREGQFSQVQ
jgi:hypothetical protein